MSSSCRRSRIIASPEEEADENGEEDEENPESSWSKDSAKLLTSLLDEEEGDEARTPDCQH